MLCVTEERREASGRLGDRGDPVGTGVQPDSSPTCSVSIEPAVQLFTALSAAVGVEVGDASVGGLSEALGSVGASLLAATPAFGVFAPSDRLRFVGRLGLPFQLPLAGGFGVVGAHGDRTRENR